MLYRTGYKALLNLSWEMTAASVLPDSVACLFIAPAQLQYVLYSNWLDSSEAVLKSTFYIGHRTDGSLRLGICFQFSRRLSNSNLPTFICHRCSQRSAHNRMHDCSLTCCIEYEDITAVKFEMVLRFRCRCLYHKIGGAS